MKGFERKKNRHPVREEKLSPEEWRAMLILMAGAIQMRHNRPSTQPDVIRAAGRLEQVIEKNLDFVFPLSSSAPRGKISTGRPTV